MSVGGGEKGQNCVHVVIECPLAVRNPRTFKEGFAVISGQIWELGTFWILGY